MQVAPALATFIKRWLMFMGVFMILPIVLVAGLIVDTRAKKGAGAKTWTFIKSAQRVVYLSAFWAAFVGGIAVGFARMLFRWPQRALAFTVTGVAVTSTSPLPAATLYPRVRTHTSS